ncbi:FkbM family methyltransferase [Clostridium chromiireducens]|uniref:FkbM family methyltransferase n=1 Tax=Clostridium chromiireducens TaxID=225345 RepID=A0A964W0Q5_9CLOT|nr:FkbM family methyltransferase [Clostridium chromiireducens]MVX62335.1 FkbM family methyltransferase [Clostridium chromiireducens]
MINYKAEICKYIDENWNSSKIEREEFFSKLKKNKKICLFGAGGMGKDIANYLSDIGITINYFCDNNKNLHSTNVYNDIKCISIEELIKIKNDVSVIISTGHYDAILQQLEKLGFADVVVTPTRFVFTFKKYLDSIDCEYIKKKICELLDIVGDEKSKIILLDIIKKWFMPISQYQNYDYYKIESENQYFNEEVVKLSDNEILVDVGAYDGDTIEQFLFLTNNMFDKIYAYELDKDCYKKMQQNVSKLDKNIQEKIILNNIGAYNANETITYSSNTASSSINSHANEYGKVVKLSEHLGDNKVTFIKMDIEGSEMKALNGAEEIIKKYKPTLAICVYHDPEHFWQVPLYIKSLVPEYKIFIRHHSEFNVETVCYAVL